MKYKEFFVQFDPKKIELVNKFCKENGMDRPMLDVTVPVKKQKAFNKFLKENDVMIEYTDAETANTIKLTEIKT